MQNKQFTYRTPCSRCLRQWLVTVVAWMACCFAMPLWAQVETINDSLPVLVTDTTVAVQFREADADSATSAPWQIATEKGRMMNDHTILVALKSNLLYWGVALPMTPNIGAEVRLSFRFTVACEVGLNPFKHQKADGSYGRSFRHLRVFPELRYWFCEAYYKNFVGLHVPFVCYNISNVHAFGGKNIIDADNKRVQGRGAGLGISYGFSWPFATHWNIEGTIGGGWLRLNHKSYPCTECGSVIKHEKKNYWGLTQAGISLSYLF